ncbi:NADPH-dependent FMN reductase [Acidibrevibacterium fodinaquatile]|uniref:NADPH-dependent FMN reductase n=1 Tax=Acidibrevibacterium fodinaquatile TaxID=1969806 RepID=UPI0019652316|nr:NADPH-dependent FMN reductase [Acidibrevibacterium fodinaquatile]
MAHPETIAFRPLIVGLGGTTRPDSVTERLLAIALDAAAALGAETVLIGSAALQMPMYDPAETDFSPAARHLVDVIRRCDGLIIASPGYHGTISGMIKNAIDHIEMLRDDPRPYLEGRAVGCLVSAHGWQATGTTLVALRSVIHALRGWPTPFGAAINATQPLFDETGACTNAVVRGQVELVGRQVMEFARMRGGYGRG